MMCVEMKRASAVMEIDLIRFDIQKDRLLLARCHFFSNVVFKIWKNAAGHGVAKTGIDEILIAAIQRSADANLDFSSFCNTDVHISAIK